MDYSDDVTKYLLRIEWGCFGKDGVNLFFFLHFKNQEYRSWRVRVILQQYVYIPFVDGRGLLNENVPRLPR